MLQPNEIIHLSASEWLDLQQEISGRAVGSMRQISPWRSGKPPASKEDEYKRWRRATGRNLYCYDLDDVLTNSAGTPKALISVKTGDEESRPTELYMMACIAAHMEIPALEMRWDGDNPATSEYRIYRRA